MSLRTHPTRMPSCYHPQHSCGKVKFSQASVILSMGGVCQTSPWANAPGQTPPGQMATAADGMHPTGCILVISYNYCCMSERTHHYHLPKLWEGNVFTPVCDSVPGGVCPGGVGVSVRGGVVTETPNMVKSGVVRILLECLLVQIILTAFRLCGF